MLDLRDYQEACVQGTLDAILANLDPLIVAPTGAGKTVLMASTALIQTAEYRQRVVIVAHRERLIEQIADTLELFDIRPVIVGAPHWQELWRSGVSNVLVGMVGTAANQIDAIGPIGCLLVDESHHVVAASYQRLVDNADRVIGYTATPERLDGNGLGKGVGGVFDVIVQAPPIADLIAADILTPFVVYGPVAGPTMAGVRMVAGDYDKKATRRVMETDTRIDEVVAAYQAHGENQQTIGFCVSTQHAKRLAAAFNAVGIATVALVGGMSKTDQRAAYRGLEDGSIRILLSCEMLGEGVNVPSVGCVILARPTASLCVYLQQIGRGLRTAPGKTRLIILDHAGNTSRHGFPDQPREWSLNAVKRVAAPAAQALKSCQGCSALIPARTMLCPHCGHLHIATPKSPPTVSARQIGRLSPRLFWRLSSQKTGNYWCQALAATVYRNRYRRWCWRSGESFSTQSYHTPQQAMLACETHRGVTP